MSNYGFRKREDPPERLVPAGSPESRHTSAATMENRRVQALIQGENLGEVTAGVLRSEDSRFHLDLEASLLEVFAPSGQPKVRLGLVDPGNDAYGIEIYNDNGDLVLDATGISVTIGPNTITELELAPGAVTQTILAPDSVTAVAVADESITATQLAPNSVTTTKIEEGSVTELILAPGSVTTTRLRDGVVTTEKIDEGAITTPLLAAGSVTAAVIEAGTITAAEIEAGTITAAELAATNLSGLFADLGEITAGIARSSTSDFIIDFDNSVATVLDAQASPVQRVRWGRLGAGPEDYGLEVRNSSGEIVLNADGLGLGVVGNLQLIDGSITGDKIEGRTITAENIESGSITVNELDASVIEAIEINVDFLSALSADLGIITAGIARDANSRFITNYNDAILEVFDEQSTPQARVRLGRLGSGSTNYGIQVIDQNGELVLGADGLGVDVVGSLQLANGAVTGGKIGFQAVTAFNIDSNAVTTPKLDARAVTAEKIAVGTILAENIQAGTITGDRIDFRTITGDRIGVNEITATEIEASTITAVQIASLNMTVGKDIQSSNFVSGGAGWRIRGVGDAEFGNVIVRGQLQLATGTYSGDLQSDDIAIRSFGGSLLGRIGVNPGGLSNEPPITFRLPNNTWVAGFGGAPNEFEIRELVAPIVKNRVLTGTGGQGDIAMTSTSGRITMNATRWTGTNPYGGEIIATAPGPRGFEVIGNLSATGDVTAFLSSDERMKDDIDVIFDAPELLEGLRGVRFRWNNLAPPWVDRREYREDVGLVAQDVREVLPEAVQERENGMLAVDYQRVIPVLVEAVKALTARVRALEA